MAFKSVEELGKKKRLKKIAVIKKAVKFDGFFCKIDDECDLILYNKDSGEYFKVLKTFVKPTDGTDNVLFELEVDLDNPHQVDFKGKDE